LHQINECKFFLKIIDFGYLDTFSEELNYSKDLSKGNKKLKNFTLFNAGLTL
jgi:hypothetical protein